MGRRWRGKEGAVRLWGSDGEAMDGNGENGKGCGGDE